MSDRAWTLGYPPAYEIATRTPGNGKAPGGYIFRTKKDAQAYADGHAKAKRYKPYEVVLPAPYDQCVTRDYARAAQARHDWHTDEAWRDSQEFMAACGVCLPNPTVYDHDVLLTIAPFIHPDHGIVVSEMGEPVHD